MGGGAVRKSIPILAAIALMLAGGITVMFAGGMVNTVHPTDEMIGVVMHKDAITTITQEDAVENAVTFDKGPANPMVMYQCCNSVAASCSYCGAVCTNCNSGRPCAYCRCARRVPLAVVCAQAFGPNAFFIGYTSWPLRSVH